MAEDHAAALARTLVLIPLGSGAAAGASTSASRVLAALRRGVGVLDARHVAAAITLELRFDPVDRVAIALRPLAPVAKLREAFDRRLVLVQFKPADQGPDGVVRRRPLTSRRRRRLGEHGHRQRGGEAADHPIPAYLHGRHNMHTERATQECNAARSAGVYLTGPPSQECRFMLDGKARATRIRILAVMTAGLAAYAVTCFVPLDAAQAPAAACRVTGRATSNGKPLPGVSVVASSRNAGSAAASIATSSDTDGTYRLSLPPGTFTLTVQLTGFVPVERDITVSAPPCDQTLDLTLGLAPRDRPLAAVQPAAGRGSAAPATPAAAPPPATNASAASAGNAARPAGRSNAPAASARFQRLEVQSAGNDSQIADVAASPERDTADAATRLMLPPGFSTDAPTEAVAINGNAASIDRGLMNDRFAALGRGEFDPLT
ncbi:MAG TPA: carboxypeptidase regulatory-like domain-containing protein, partial [Thermomicrobiales bacterium]|nr:carboxypeptidase regulatory-like domain-containing protein [Thermomicrobiales bacterium]